MNLKIFLIILIIYVVDFHQLHGAHPEYELVTKSDKSESSEKLFLLQIGGKQISILDALSNVFVTSKLVKNKLNKSLLDYCLDPDADPCMRVLAIDGSASGSKKWDTLDKISRAGLRTIFKNNWYLVSSHNDEELEARKIPAILVLGTSDKIVAKNLIGRLKCCASFLKVFPEDFNYSILKDESPNNNNPSFQALLKPVSSLMFKAGYLQYSIHDFVWMAANLKNLKIPELSCLEKTFVTYTSIVSHCFNGTEFNSNIYANLSEIDEYAKDFFKNANNFVFVPASEAAQKIGVSGLFVLKTRTPEEDTDPVVNQLAQFGISLLYTMLNHDGTVDQKLNCY